MKTKKYEKYDKYNHIDNLIQTAKDMKKLTEEDNSEAIDNLDLNICKTLLEKLKEFKNGIGDGTEHFADLKREVSDEHFW